MERYVVGSYASPQEAVNAVNQLQEEGYQKEDITLISSTESKNSISNTTDIVGTTNETDIDTVDKENDRDDRSIWKKIKESFTIHTKCGNTKKQKFFFPNFKKMGQYFYFLSFPVGK